MGVGNVSAFPSIGVGMKTHSKKPTAPSMNPMNRTEDQQEWFDESVSLVGEVIGFWGFKENHGRIWALLYLSTHPVSTSAIRTYLNLSKGAISMLLNDLEKWGVVTQHLEQTGRERLYTANQNFIEMIVRVMELRESDMLNQMVDRLQTVQQQATEAQATHKQIQSLQEMVDLATMVKQLVLVGQKMQTRNIRELSTLLRALDAML